MQNILIAERGNIREYIALDPDRKEIYKFEGFALHNAVMVGVILEGTKHYNSLAPFWQSYCRKAWQKWGL
jgi:hypothetical protein